jgi:Arc/MetJ family transcription regulator
MARTNIDLDDRLVEEGLLVFKCKTKKELIHLALQELLKTEKRKEILKLRGRLRWEGDLEERRSRPSRLALACVDSGSYGVTSLTKTKIRTSMSIRVLTWPRMALSALN